MQTNSHLVADVRELVCEIGELERPDVDNNQHLINDLGMDSMLLLEVLSSLEQNYKISIPETEFPNMTTINQCVAVVQRYQGATA